MQNSLTHQRGITLIVALIMLVMITLLGLSSFNSAKTSLLTVSNMQQQNQVTAAINETFDEVFSNKKYSETPTATLSAPCGGVTNTRCIDINGDGLPDVTVTLTPAPTCVKSQVIPTNKIDLTVVEDYGCSVGEGDNTGIIGAVSGDSLCSESIWEINAVGVDNTTQTTVRAKQGIASRIPTNDTPPGCS